MDKAVANTPRSSPKWRYRALGVLGELLVTVGLVLALFVPWKLWWTDVEAHQNAQNELRVFDEEAEAAAGVPATETIDASEQRTDAAPVPTSTSGEVFATLWVPRWGPDYRVPVAEGIDLLSVLNLGFAGHYPETSKLGQVGNFVLAAHRVSHGAAFRDVDTLVSGDALVVQTPEAWYVYTVTGSEIVQPTETRVLASVPGDIDASPTMSVMTLTTCHPRLSTRERFVVYSTLSWWAPRSAGWPPGVEAH